MYGRPFCFSPFNPSLTSAASDAATASAIEGASIVELTVAWSAVRVVVAAPQGVYREAISRLLESEGLRVVGEASDAACAIRLARQLAPQVLLMDWAVTGGNGAAVLRELRALNTRVVVLANAIGSDDVCGALVLGVRGIVFQDANGQTLLRAVRTVANGEYWLARSRMRDLIESLRHSRDGEGRDQGSMPGFGLTDREIEIASAVAAAWANKDIAVRFSISEKTVKRHLSHIFEKLGLSTRLELAVFALNHREQFRDVSSLQAR